MIYTNPGSNPCEWTEGAFGSTIEAATSRSRTVRPKADAEPDQTRAGWRAARREGGRAGRPDYISIH
eukprot:3920262-Heterocapsa_arctica.AAC.1